MLHGSKPHSTLKDCQIVYWKGFLSLHPWKSSPPVLSLATSASHTHPGLSFSVLKYPTPTNPCSLLPT